MSYRGTSIKISNYDHGITMALRAMALVSNLGIVVKANKRTALWRRAFLNRE